MVLQKLKTIQRLVIVSVCMSPATSSASAKPEQCIPINREVVPELAMGGALLSFYNLENIIWSTSDLNQFSADDSNWQTFDFDQWCYMETIGEGMEGTAVRIRKSEASNHSKDYVLKIYKSSWPREEIFNLIRAGNILSKQSYFTQVYGVIADEQSIDAVFMTLSEANVITTLRKTFDIKKHGESLGSIALAKLLIALLQGMTDMHSRGIIHNDLHDENVMLDHQGKVKFIDFDGSRVVKLGLQSAFPGSDDVQIMYRDSISGFIDVAQLRDSERVLFEQVTHWMYRYRYRYSSDITWEQHLLKVQETIEILQTISLNPSLDR